MTAQPIDDEEVDGDADDLGALLLGPQTWVGEPLCAQTDPDAFFPEKGGSTQAAKQICAMCEVRLQCLDWAFANTMRFGIWGGLSERERRRIRSPLWLENIHQSALAEREALSAADRFDSLERRTRASDGLRLTRPFYTSPKEAETMKDQQRFPGIITYLRQQSKGMVTIAAGEHATPPYELLKAASVASVRELRPVIRKLGWMSPAVEVIEINGELLVTLVTPASAPMVQPPALATTEPPATKPPTATLHIAELPLVDDLPAIDSPKIEEPVPPPKARPTRRPKLHVVPPPPTVPTSKLSARDQNARKNFLDQAEHAKSREVADYWRRKADEVGVTVPSVASITA